MSYEEILFSGKGPIGIITLNNPRRISACARFSIQLKRRLKAVSQASKG